MVAGALLAAAHGADVAIMNGGGLRTGLRAGPATLGDVLDALPFGNTLATVMLTGADLRTAIEHGLGLVGRGGFPQLAGMRLEWSALRLAGDRITQLEVHGPNGTWTEVEPERRYLVVTNDFIRGGGDGYTVLRDRGIDPYDAGPDVAGLVAAALAGSQP